MSILGKLQDRFPVVAAFYPIYESLLRRYSTGAETQDGERIPERPAGSEMQNGSCQLDNESNIGGMNPAGELFDQVPQDGMGMAFPFSFPFGNLFEDAFLNSPSQPTAYCEDDVYHP
jgi:hypothetical protein